jgi:hypothetical protein
MNKYYQYAFFQGKLKPINEQNIEYSKPNSPVILTPAPSNIIYIYGKCISIKLLDLI